MSLEKSIFSQKIAVVVHLFYEEQWPEFVAALENINSDFSLYISLRPESMFAHHIRQRFPNAVIKLFPNLGRDVAPFLDWLPELQAFDLVCKIHTKRSDGRHAVWRKVVMNGLLGSSEIVDDYITAFARDPELALAGARFNYVDGAGHVSVCARAMAVQHGPIPNGWGFFAGTMFWCRPKVFAGLDRIYPQDCFSAHNDSDGHPEHVIERVFGLVVMQAEQKIMLRDVESVVDLARNLHGNANWGDTYNAFQEHSDDPAPMIPGGEQSLRQIYRAHQGYAVETWSGRLTQYDLALRGLRDMPVRLLQMGIQNGGALEIWAKYFPKGKIFIGCDRDERGAKLRFDEARIHLVQADTASHFAKTKIVQLCGLFDIIIDTNTDPQRDSIAAFLHYFPNLAEGGIYIVEDVHHATARRGGHPAPSAFFRAISDAIDRPEQGDVQTRFAAFETAYDIEFTMFRSVLSVEFSNAVIILRKGWAEGRGQRMLSGIGAPIKDIPLVAPVAPAVIPAFQMRLSVVIPFHNGSAYLADAIRSVHRQTRRAEEIIVVDAGSDISQAQWLRAFALDAGFDILTHDSANLAAACNLGMGAATGSHICLLDQTDMLLDHHHAAFSDAWQVAQSTTEHLAWVAANYRQADPYFVDFIAKAPLPPPILIEEMILQDLGLARSATILDRVAALGVGGFDPDLRFYATQDLFLRLSLHGYRGVGLDSDCASCRRDGQGWQPDLPDLDSAESFFRKWFWQDVQDPDRQSHLRANLKRRMMAEFFQISAQRDSFFDAYLDCLRRIESQI